MDPEHVDEWSWLQQQALGQLKTRIDRKGFITRLQALVLPSFEDSWRYELLAPVPSRSKPALAVKTVWHRGIDSAKFANPVVRLSYGAGVRQLPTIEEFVAEVEAALVDDLCAKAATLKVPLFAGKSRFGLDGTSLPACAGQQPTCRPVRMVAVSSRRMGAAADVSE